MTYVGLYVVWQRVNVGRDLNLHQREYVEVSACTSRSTPSTDWFRYPEAWVLDERNSVDELGRSREPHLVCYGQSPGGNISFGLRAGEIARALDLSCRVRLGESVEKERQTDDDGTLWTKVVSRCALAALLLRMADPPSSSHAPPPPRVEPKPPPATPGVGPRLAFAHRFPRTARYSRTAWRYKGLVFGGIILTYAVAS